MSARFREDCPADGRCADFGDPMVRRYVSRTLDAGERFTVAKIEAFPRIEGIFKATATRPRPRSRWKCREMVVSPHGPKGSGRRRDWGL